MQVAPESFHLVNGSPDAAINGLRGHPALCITNADFEEAVLPLGHLGPSSFELFA